MSSRILSGIFGFIVPLTLFLIFLFCAEYTIEITLGVLAFLVNNAVGTTFDTKPDFIGPTDIIQAAIGFFPDVWDLGTLLFYGTISEGTYLLYVLVAIFASFTGVGAFHTLKNELKGISAEALLRSGMRFTWGQPPNGNGDEDEYGTWPPDEDDVPDDGSDDGDGNGTGGNGDLYPV